jgi:hypothetical protein
MEDYGAADERPLARCLRDVADADVYVGLFAWRYGYVPRKGNPDKRSITELEYLEAERLGKPRLVFVLDDRAPWPPGMMDANTGDNERGALVKNLRAKLLRDRLAARFESTDQLASRVISAVFRWQTDQAESAAPAPARKAPKARTAEPASRAKARARGDLLWAPGSRLRVRFLNGPPLLHDRVLRLAQIWCAYANISFEASDASDAEVRVAFNPGDGSWAYEGTQCLTVPHDEPTVNFDELEPDSPIADMESVVLHEFSHVLGLAHEHHNPEAGIEWNKALVYKELSASLGWKREQVDAFIFATWEKNRYPIRKPFDPLSISAYPVPAEWMKGGPGIGRNTAISAGDREFISRLYPYPQAAAKKASPAVRARVPSRKRRRASLAVATRG